MMNALRLYPQPHLGPAVRPGLHSLRRRFCQNRFAHSRQMQPKCYDDVPIGQNTHGVPIELTGQEKGGPAIWESGIHP